MLRLIFLNTATFMSFVLTMSKEYTSSNSEASPMNIGLTANNCESDVVIHFPQKSEVCK